MEDLNLSEGEQILFECSGKLQQKLPKKSSNQLKISSLGDSIQILMLYGEIHITNDRVIAQGEIKISGLNGPSPKMGKFGTDLSHYYEIQLINIEKLRKTPDGIAFEVKGVTLPAIVKIDPHETSQVKLEESKDKLMQLLTELRLRIRKRGEKRKKESRKKE